MAAKTVVCQECGTAAAPGRYACAECGALLASVAVSPRSSSGADAGHPDPAPQAPGGAGAETPAAEPTISPGPVAVGELIAVGEHGPASAAAVATPRYAKLGRPRPAAPPPDLLVDAGAALPFDEDAPIGTIGVDDGPDQPDVPDLAPTTEALDPVADVAVADVTPGSDVSAASVAVPRVGAPSTDPAPVREQAVPVVPGWPPVGSPPVAAWPEPRTPAGAYLPPSAVLPSLDGPLAVAALGGGGAAAAPVQRGLGAGWAERGSAAISGTFDHVRITAAASRRTIGIGSTVAAIGIFLPWINGLPGEGPFSAYLVRWGLAGAGMWLVLIGLIVFVIVAGSSGRPESWPIGLPSVAAATFLGGLLWPYLVGGSGRSIGIWVVLVGAIVLAVGGLLDRRRRHDGPEPAVGTGDAGGR